VDTATNSRAASALDALERAVSAAARERPVALLVVRAAELERIAWREGRAAARRLERRTAVAFRSAATRILRGEDRIGHDVGSDLFVAAMLGAPRICRQPSPADCRMAVERIAAVVRSATDLAVETGWTFVERASAHSMHDEAEIALERGARERERFAFFAAVGHELRTPLTSICGYLETLLEDELDPELRRQFVRTAGREASRLGRLIESMLDFSMLDLSGDAAAAASCDLAEQVLVACDAVAPHARRRGVRVECDTVPAARVGLPADRCAQAMINVLDNAIGHGRANGCVRVSCRAHPPYVCVRVDDDGGGLKGSARPRGSGHGIGLSIVRAIVGRAGGDVRVGSSPLGGARFELRLPVRAEISASTS
jgi:two-component system phosphate regulon sensor histidine kinase PhoR